MSFINCLSLTLISAALCIMLPKLLSMLLKPKTNSTTSLPPELIPQQITTAKS